MSMKNILQRLSEIDQPAATVNENSGIPFEKHYSHFLSNLKKYGDPYKAIDKTISDAKYWNWLNPEDASKLEQYITNRFEQENPAPSHDEIEKSAQGISGDEDPMLGIYDSGVGESLGGQGDIGGAHGDETISPIHGQTHDLPMDDHNAFDEKRSSKFRESKEQGETYMENLDAASLKYLAGIKQTIAECGMTPVSPTGASLNVTAASGPELSGILKDLLGLAGVKQNPAPMEPVSAEPPKSEPVDMVVKPSDSQGPSMKDMIAMIDKPEDVQDSMNPNAGGEEVATADNVDDVEEKVEDLTQQVAAYNNGEEETDENRDYSNSPHEADGMDGVRQFGDINNNFQNALVGQTKTDESVVASLYAEYQKFIAEGERHDLTKKLTNRMYRIDKKLGKLAKDTGRTDINTDLKNTKSEIKKGVKQLPNDKVKASLSTFETVDKSKIPAFKRKEKGGDWKVSTQDLEKEKTKSPTTKAGLAQKKKDIGMNEVSADTLKKYKTKATQSVNAIGLKTDRTSADKATMSKRIAGKQQAEKKLAAKGHSEPHHHYGDEIQKSYYSDKPGSRYVGDSIQHESKPSAGMSKKEKSSVAKKAHAGKDIGKPGKNFEKVASKAAKEYGSKEAGQKVAAAAMWKNAKK